MAGDAAAAHRVQLKCPYRRGRGPSQHSIPRGELSHITVRYWRVIIDGTGSAWSGADGRQRVSFATSPPSQSEACHVSRLILYPRDGASWLGWWLLAVVVVWVIRMIRAGR